MIRKLLFGGAAIVVLTTILLVAFYALHSGGAPFVEAYSRCVSESADAREQGSCLRMLAQDSYREYSVREIENKFSAITDSQLLQRCHEFFHYLGWEAYQETSNLSKAFAEASGMCDSGMYHGVAEEYLSSALAQYSPEEFVSAVIPEACRQFGSDATWGDVSLCYHGLGHAFMFITDNDLPSALEYCDSLGASSRSNCATGVFMENLSPKGVGRFDTHPTNYPYTEDTQASPCSLVPVHYQELCYSYHGVAEVIRTQGDFEAAFRYCEGVPAQFRRQCFWGVGADIPGPHMSAGEAGKKCSFALSVSALAYEACIGGAMSFLVQLARGDLSTAQEFCAEITDAYKPQCYRAAGAEVQQWLRAGETKAQQCSKFKEVEAQTACHGVREQ